MVKVILLENVLMAGSRRRAGAAVEVDEDFALYLMKENLAVVAGEATALNLDAGSPVSIPEEALDPIVVVEPEGKARSRRTTKKVEK